MVLANPNYWVFNISCWCWVVSIPDLGDLQRGPDGKIYIGNNTSNQSVQLGPNNYSGLSSFLHVIHQPNMAGLLCQPQVNAINLPQATRMGLPNDIVYFPRQDTISAQHLITACFKDSIVISADTGKEYRWLDSYTQKARTIKQTGSYFVRYTGIDCALHFDTFIVSFPKLPIAGTNGFSCPRDNSGRLSVKQAAGDTTGYSYSWKDATGNVIRTVQSKNGDTITGLDTGSYFLELTTTSGCDTILPFYVRPLPVPEASFEVDSIVCTDEAIPFWNTGGGVIWQWTFGDGDSSEEQQPVHSYNKTGFYTVILSATNEEGCSNTIAKEIEVKDFDITLIASQELVKSNTVIWLTTSATEPYEVLAWRPQELFADQNKEQQEIKATDSRYYTVIAQSQYGCIDSAAIQVRVHPVIFMPTVFSPNGDGKNDLFRPVVSGEPVKVRYFQVYDRWGKMVWKAGSNDSKEGWDGTYAGTPAELGTYFYFINIETATGETFQQKGDVTLIR
jgi:gliding motility-associated-like protein